MCVTRSIFYDWWVIKVLLFPGHFPPHHNLMSVFILFFRFYLLIFRKKGREGAKEGEKHQCVVAFHVAPTGDLAYNPSMCPDWELTWQPSGLQPTLNPLSYTNQGLMSNFNIKIFYTHTCVCVHVSVFLKFRMLSPHLI